MCLMKALAICQERNSLSSADRVVKAAGGTDAEALINIRIREIGATGDTGTAVTAVDRLVRMALAARGKKIGEAFHPMILLDMSMTSIGHATFGISMP